MRCLSRFANLSLAASLTTHRRWATLPARSLSYLTANHDGQCRAIIHSPLSQNYTTMGFPFIGERVRVPVDENESPSSVLPLLSFFRDRSRCFRESGRSRL